MKRSLIGASLLVLTVATSAIASEVKENNFVGLEIGSTSYDDTATINSLDFSASDTESGASLNLIAGKYLGKSGRVYGTVGRVNTDGGTTTIFGIAYDYLIYNSSDFTPFVGATLGYQQIDLDDTSLDFSGMTYGTELGVQYAINKNFDLELGYRYNFDSHDDSEIYYDYTINAEISNVRQWYMGVNYNF